MKQKLRRSEIKQILIKISPIYKIINILNTMKTKATLKTLAIGSLLVTSSFIGFAMQKPSESAPASLALKNIEALSTMAEYPDCPDCPSLYDIPNAGLATEQAKRLTLKCSADGSISYEQHTLTGGFRAGVSYFVLYERFYCKDMEKCVCCDVNKIGTRIVLDEAI